MSSTDDKEAKIRAQALALVMCGLRPAVIRMLCGPAFSINDYLYLFKVYSPLPTDRRQGRMRFNPEVSGLRRAREVQLQKFTPTATALLIEGIDLANEALEFGASKADSLAAAWRIIAHQNGHKESDIIHGVTGEDLATLWLNTLVGEIIVSTCVGCNHRFLQLNPGGHRCYHCDTKQLRRPRKAA